MVMAVAALASACTSDASRPLGSDPPVSLDSVHEHVRVIGGDSVPGAPPACRPLAAANLVQRFLVAIATGDDLAISAILAPDPRFRWYTAALDDRSYAASGISEARALLRRRVQAHEGGRLLALRVQFDRRRGLGQLAYALTLKADDLLPARDGSDRLVEGKGAIHCDTGTIIVWSMGTVGRGTTLADLPPYCPGGPELGEVVIACAG